jgi:hypothetical protein
MARFVSLPSGTVFAQKPLQFNTPLQGSNLSTKDVVDILNVAEAVGKSESIGALAGKAKENIGGMVEGVKDWWNKDKTGEAPKAGEAGQSVEEGIRPPADMEKAGRRDMEGGSVFNRSAQSTPLDTSGTGAVQPPPQASPQGQVPDKATPQQAPVNPEIPALPPILIAPKVGAGIAKQVQATQPTPAAQTQATEPTKPSGFDPYIYEAEKLVGPPDVGPDGAATPEAQRINRQQVLAKAAELKQQDEINKAEQAQSAKGVFDIGNIPQRPQAEIDAEKKASAARVDEQYKLDAAAKARAEAARKVQEDKLRAEEQAAIEARAKAKAAYQAHPKGKFHGGQPSSIVIPRADVNTPPPAKFEAPLPMYPQGVPLPAQGTPTSQAPSPELIDKLVSQGSEALTPEEKFALMAGGPAQARAPQPSATGKKVIGEQGVETQGLKQKATEGRRPEVSVPPAQGGAAAPSADASSVRTGAQRVVIAPSVSVPQVQPAQPGIAQPQPAGPAPATMQQAAAMAAGPSGQKAGEQVARKEAQPAADFNTQYEKILGQIQAKPTAPAPAGTKATTERALLAQGDPETILKMVEERMKADEAASAIQIPANVTYQQLIALARKATRPADQQKVLAAFETARNKPPPKTLVEMYSGDNETRAIAMLEAAFPAKAQEPDSYTKQLKYAQAYKSVADSIKAVQQAEESQAGEALKSQKAYREESEIAAGDVTAEVANKLVKARLYVEQAGDAAEKARRTRELVELEKAAMGALTAERIAKADQAMRVKLSEAKAKGGGGKKGEKITPSLEWNIKNGSLKDSIDEQRKIVANIQNQATRRSNLERALPVLRQQRQAAIAAGPAFAPNVSAYDVKISEMEGELASLPTAQELRTQFGLEQEALKALGQRQVDMADEMLGRKGAVAPAQTSVPLVQGAGGQGAGPQTKGQTGKGPTTTGKGK